MERVAAPPADLRPELVVFFSMFKSCTYCSPESKHFRKAAARSSSGAWKPPSKSLFTWQQHQSLTVSL